jgi:Carbon-nitrogen hydrolase
MHATETPPPHEPLVDQVRAAGKDKNLTRVVAILWTWLEAHLVDLCSLQEKPPAIRAAALLGAFSGVDDQECERLREAPLRNAAYLLALIGNHLRPRGGASVAEQTTGFDGSPVVVIWKAPGLAERAGRGQGPPTAIEHPSLTALAPRLTVCPLTVCQIDLLIHRPENDAWNLTKATLERGLAGESPPLAVHLNPLESYGMSGWTEIETPHVGWFDATLVDGADETRCVEAARDAVAAAAGGPAVLIVPELAATPTVVRAISESLLEHATSEDGEGPVMTVVGLYHEGAEISDAIDPALAGDAPPAAHLNEAVVLGPDGKELWRHQKLSSAQHPTDRDDPVSEDVQLGRALTIVSTPIGLVTVVICLDVFAPRPRARLASSGADVLLVPSLSNKVLRHRTSLAHLVQVLWGIGFVCNRGIPRIPTETDDRSVWNADDTRSFWAIQRHHVTVPPERLPHEHPSFVFRLADLA